MIDYSLHILDLAQNAIKAKASIIKISIEESTTDDRCMIKIEDNGIGMNDEEVSSCTSPFYTKRTERRVGLGIPLFIQSCEQADGYAIVESVPNRGTTIRGIYHKNHIDALPLGEIEETLYVLMVYSENIEIMFQYQAFNKTFLISSTEIKQIFKDIPLTNYVVMTSTKEYIKNNIKETLDENIRRFKKNA